MAIIPSRENSGNGASFELTPAQEKVASGLDFESLKEYLRACAAEANVIDYDARTGEVSEPSRPTPKTSAERVPVTINGKTVTKIAEWRTSDGEAGRQLAINAAQAAGARELMTDSGQQQHQDEPDTFQGVIFDTVSSRYRDGKTGAFLSDADAKRLIAQSSVDGAELSRQADLEMKFRRGELTAAQYIAASGCVQQAIDAQIQDEWQQATEAALAEDGPLSDWPGSPDGKLLEQLSQRIQDLGLENAQNRVSALAEAWASLKAEMEQSEQATIDAEFEKEYSAAVTKEQQNFVLAKYFKGRTVHSMSPDEQAASGYWGR
jgi:hypothetical protein